MGKALLIIVIGFSTILSGMMFSLTSNKQRSANEVVAQYEKWIARHALESASNVSASKLYQDFGWQAGFSGRSFGDAGYSVTVTDITGDSTIEAKKMQIQTTALYASTTDSSTSIFVQPAYSYYLFFLNNWPASLEYATGDTLVGPIHSNTRMRIKGNPVFIAKVSSADNNYHRLLGGDDPKFYGGVEFGVQTIPLPDLAPLTATAMASGHRFTDELWLRFNPGGTYDYSTDDWETTFTESIANYNGIILTEPGTDRNIHVEGTLNGQITVLSDRDILIEDNLTYLSDPIANPNSDDYLGLIARHRVTIVENPANSLDVEIHAAIIAHHDEINVPNYATGGPRGTLTIVGSVVENDFQPYGTDAPTGYTAKHIYDFRLRDKTPPYFPRLDRTVRLYRSH